MAVNPPLFRFPYLSALLPIGSPTEQFAMPAPFCRQLGSKMAATTRFDFKNAFIDNLGFVRPFPARCINVPYVNPSVTLLYPACGGVVGGRGNYLTKHGRSEKYWKNSRVPG